MPLHDATLSVRNLSVRYLPNIQAVENVSFDIQKAGILALTGASGSGKSSIAFAIPRLLSDCEIEGEIIFKSEIFGHINLLNCDSGQLGQILGKEISIVFQEPYSSFNPVIKCGAQILETLLKHSNTSGKIAKDSILETLNLCGLKNSEKAYNSYPHELSGGQLQRLAIAMAIINKPLLLIADEMTSNLDSQTRDEILDLLLQINSEFSLSILFISHEISIFQNFCEHIHILKNGQTVESGTTKELLLNPKEEYTKSLISNSKYEKPFAQPISSQSILSIKDLEIEYHMGRSSLFSKQKMFKAVDKVSFNLKQGEILGLVGKSGSGKTSIGKSIVRLIDNISGHILYKNKALFSIESKDMRDIRRCIQIIFQDSEASLDPRLSIAYSLKEPFESFNLLEKGEASEEKIDELLALVGLGSEYKKRLPAELSGGEKQRVCIARALSLKPEILICDESLASLDANIKREILNLLASLRQEKGLSILFISHDINTVEYLCDRIIRIEEGKIISEKLNA